MSEVTSDTVEEIVITRKKGERNEPLISPDTVREMRMSIGLSQYQLGKALGVTKRCIENWETRKDSVNFRRIPQWAVIRLREMMRSAT